MKYIVIDEDDAAAEASLIYKQKITDENERIGGKLNGYPQRPSHSESRRSSRRTSTTMKTHQKRAMRSLFVFKVDNPIRRLCIIITGMDIIQGGDST